MQTLASLATVVALMAQTASEPATVISRYVEALGGEAALRAIRTRVTEGEFDNGRGLKTRFRAYEQAPNKRVTIIGTNPIDSDGGSGRGYDGTTGWDKNFIGTGLRTVNGAELAALAREAELLRPLHLLDQCPSPSIESTADDTVVICQTAAGGRTRLRFARTTGLLSQQETESDGRTTRFIFEDYRLVDGLRIPYRTRIVLPGATVVYAIASVRHNEAIAERVFTQPR